MTKILIIEDNDDIRENIVEILELSGYTVFEAGNGLDGAEMAIKNFPDIILCDIMMPGMDGYGVLEKLSSHDQAKTIPFVFITAKSERVDVRKGMDMGADDYLTKPFDDIELLNAIETRLKKKEMQKDYFSKSLESINSLLSKKSGLDALKNALEARKIRVYKKKQSIYSEGDRVSGIWLLLSGKVKTTKLTEDGRELLTGIFEADDFIGTNILFSKGAYLDTATALEECHLTLLPNEQFEELITRYPDVAERFIKILANQVREKEAHLMQLAYNSVRKRIAEALLRFYRQQTTNDQTVSVSRTNLAAMSGTAQETVSRTLTDFTDEGLIEKKGNLIVILDERKLDLLKN